jgi:hypothetical protein
MTRVWVYLLFLVLLRVISWIVFVPTKKDDPQSHTENHEAFASRLKQIGAAPMRCRAELS